jgi:transposase
MWFGKVDEKFSTQECGACGARTGGLGAREWTCSECAAVHQRDPNSAQVIRARGLAWLDNEFSATEEARADEAVVNERRPEGPRAVGHDRSVGGTPFL